MACRLLFVLTWLSSVVRLLALLDLHVHSIVFFVLWYSATQWCAARLPCLPCMACCLLYVLMWLCSVVRLLALLTCMRILFSLLYRLMLRSGVLPIFSA